MSKSIQYIWDSIYTAAISNMYTQYPNPEYAIFNRTKSLLITKHKQELSTFKLNYKLGLFTIKEANKQARILNCIKQNIDRFNI